MKERWLVLDQDGDKLSSFMTEDEAVAQAKLDAADDHAEGPTYVAHIIGEARPTNPPVTYTKLPASPKKR